MVIKHNVSGADSYELVNEVCGFNAYDLHFSLSQISSMLINGEFDYEDE